LDSRPGKGLEANSQQELVALMARVAAGDRAAFRLVYERTAGKLFASVRRILGNQTAAEDAVQEAYVRIWRRAGDFEASIASPIAWMTTIARHAAIDTLRRGAERVSASAKTIDADLAETLADPAGTAPASGGRALSACLEKLEADRRSMVLLAYCYGWSREELSRRFAKPVATVKTVLRRSLILLKECLGG
jgi:RNA polymerase sigma-70 factor (ECF subfamily)